MFLLLAIEQGATLPPADLIGKRKRVPTHRHFWCWLDRFSLIHNHKVVDYLTATLIAISDPTRRAILNRLAQGPAPVGELAAPFKITQQAVSKHLHQLQRARLIEKQRQGRQNFCRLNPAPLAEAITWMEHCRQEWEERFDRLDAVVAEIKAKKSHD